MHLSIYMYCAYLWLDAFLTSIFLNDETTGANLSTQLASFDSHGNGFVNFITGKLRLDSSLVFLLNRIKYGR